MPDSNDVHRLYQEWLDIPAERLPPNHYALLGLDDFESDLETIDAAAKSRSAYLHQLAAGPERKRVQEILNQVAVARRTLLNDSARNEYDQQLRDTASEPQSSSAAAGASAAEPVATAAPDLDRPAATTPRRKRSGDWKYHAVSAAVLLGVVGLIYVLNRNEGGRRAAEARPETGSTASRSSDPGGSESARRASDPAAETRSASSPAPSRPQRRSPVAKPRESGSGLGSGLGGKFGNVLAEIAAGPESDSTEMPDGGSRQDGFQPLGGLLIGAVKQGNRADDAPDELSAVGPFPSAVQQHFVSDRGFDWFEVADQTLRVNVSGDQGGKVFALRNESLALAPGAAVSIRASLGAPLRRDVQAGLAIDGIRVGVRPTKAGVELFARDRGEDAELDSIAKVSGDRDPVTLTILRDAEQTDVLRWFASIGDQLRSGTITTTSLPVEAALEIFVVPPRQSLKQPLWLSDLKVRPAGGG
jgi:hypothetical protein